MKSMWIILFLSIIPGTVSSQIPDWYSTHKHRLYPPEEYILGVGSASGENGIERAKRAAQTDIAAQIKVQVQSESKSVVESFQSGKDEQLSSDFKSRTNSIVTDEITGAEIVETFTDQTASISYALIVLPREKYCQSIRIDLLNGWTHAGELRTASKDFLQKGRLTEAIQSLTEAKTLVSSLLPKQVLYNAVSSKPFADSRTFSPGALDTELRSVLASIRIEKSSGDKQEGRIGQKLGEPFSVCVSVGYEKNFVPCPGVKIVFENDNRNLHGEAVTDQSGIARYWAIVRMMNGNGVQAYPDFPGLQREYEGTAASSAIYFTWTALPSPVMFTLRVKSTGQKSDEMVKELLLSNLTKIGYRTAGDARYLLDISLTKLSSNRVDGMGGTLFSVGIEISVLLHDKDQKVLLGIMKIVSTGAAKSESEAVEKAVANAEIKQNDLAEMLEKAK